MDTTKDTTSTKNATLAELAATAHDFLTTYAGMPEIANVELHPVLGEWDDLHAGIELHSDRPGSPEQIVAWARELNTWVSFVDMDTYIECSTLTRVDGHTVKIWTHIKAAVFYPLLAALGESFVGEAVSVDPARLLPADEPAPGQRFAEVIPADGPAAGPPFPGRPAEQLVAAGPFEGQVG